MRQPAKKLAQPGATASGLHGSAPLQSAPVQGLVGAPAPAVSNAEMQQHTHRPSALQPAVTINTLISKSWLACVLGIDIMIALRRQLFFLQ